MTQAMPDNRASDSPAGSAPAAAGSEALSIRRVAKRYGDVQAVSDGTLSLRQGELMAFLGPSGCGKSTLLNMIAGFETPDAGEIWMGDLRLDTLPPNRRPVAMVFQHYALFPHMRVADNIAYGLRARREATSVVNERIDEMVAMLKLDGLERRYPAELSGGQRQRVAIARALAVRPRLLLLDEALSALDKNLREAMQIELSLLLRRLEITTILVTHDQREAFSVGDRIAVMERGDIVQVGTPEEVYARPKSQFVVEFLGSTSRLPVEAAAPPAADGRIAVTSPTGIALTCEAPAIRLANSGALFAYIRAEDITLSDAPTAVHRVNPATVRLITFLGSVRRCVLDIDGHQIVADIAPSGAAARIATGDRLYLDFPPAACHLIHDML
jgi:ABC-type Fe3+/spermidine/putrescine transport system ATPase subunit